MEEIEIIVVSVGPKEEDLKLVDAVKEIPEIGDKLSEHVYKNNIQNVMMVDRSARPTYIPFLKSWKKKGLPTEKKPNIYFTNPMGYNLREKSINNLAREFDSTYRNLAEDKNQSIMLFDTCMHTGSSLSPIIKTLKESGYQNVTIGLAQPKNFLLGMNFLGPKVDFTALNETATAGCVPMGKDRMLNKNDYSLLSSVNRNDFARSHGREMRKHLSELSNLL